MGRAFLLTGAAMATIYGGIVVGIHWYKTSKSRWESTIIAVVFMVALLAFIIPQMLSG
ncbi:MAG: hypothetical protein K8J31_08785 [Anaerolineae bacterium]|nr:hypothetical protein [Anaerolineae bacterium]